MRGGGDRVSIGFVRARQTAGRFVRVEGVDRVGDRDLVILAELRRALRQLRQTVVAGGFERFFRVGERRIATRLRLRRQNLRFRVQRQLFLRTQRAQSRQTFFFASSFLKLAKFARVRMIVAGTRRSVRVVTVRVVITNDRLKLRRIPGRNFGGPRGVLGVDRGEFALISRLDRLVFVGTFPGLRLERFEFLGVARVFAAVIVPGGVDRRVVGVAQRLVGRRPGVLRGANGGVVGVGNGVERLKKRDVARKIDRLAVERREGDLRDRRVAQDVPVALGADA